MTPMALSSQVGRSSVWTLLGSVLVAGVVRAPVVEAGVEQGRKIRLFPRRRVAETGRQVFGIPDVPQTPGRPRELAVRLHEITVHLGRGPERLRLIIQAP